MPEREDGLAEEAGVKRALSLVDSFIESLAVERNLSPNTQRAYNLDLGDFVAWCGRMGVEYDSVTHRGFRRYLAELDSEGYSRRTINRRLSALRSFYSWLTVNGLVEADPTAVVVSPKQPKSLPRKISPADVDRLLAVNDCSSPEGLRNQALLELMYACGARIGEVATLKVSDVSFPARQVTLFGKGSKQRIVPLHPLALDTLARYLADARPKLATPKSGTALFISTRGNPMSADSLRRLFKQCCAKAGLPADVAPHDMRHTFATDLVENGADLRSVQELLGHASLSTTQIYTHLSAAHLKDEHRQAHPRG